MDQSLTTDHWGTLPYRRLMLLAFVLTLLTCGVAALASWCASDAVPQERPVWSLIGVWAVAGVVYLAASKVAGQLPATRKSLVVIFVPAIVMRAILLPTTPILEVDLYRYLWDGNAIEAGFSPYRYSPQEVRFARDFGTTDEDLERLAAKAGSSRALADIIDTVHFGELRTPYPAVSQAVFALAAVVTPDASPTWVHLLVMKLLITSFDLGVMAVLAWLLIRIGRSPGLAVIYGWCPLPLKEFANSGHLDAIAVLFSIAAVAALAVAPRRASRSGQRGWVFAAAVSLALAIGAKLYPIVLAPLFAVWTWRTVGARLLISATLVCGCVTGLLLVPLLPNGEDPVEQQATISLAAPGEADNDGLQAFLNRWEINDLIFAVIVENLKRDDHRERQPEPWFSVLPDSARRAVLDRSRYVIDRGSNQPFLLARSFVAAIYLVVMVWLAGRIGGGSADGKPDLQCLLEAAFLAIAWLWLLAPTQNPWYWTWALPFVVFARLRAWLLLGILSLIYYARFWFEAHTPTLTFAGVSYTGVHVFDFLVVWLEFAPFWLTLGFELWRGRESRSGLTQP